jgi:septum formation protein
MLHKEFDSYDVVLASGSPRRQELFSAMGIPHRVEVRNIDEVYPNHLKASQITDYLALKKAEAFDQINTNQIIITSDTIVWFEGRPVEKPLSRAHALEMLESLSGSIHEVYTSVCFKTKKETRLVNDCTKVWIDKISRTELEYYVDHYQPMDKAGSYGIQDFFGYIAVSRIEGCYYNVMGLPTRLVYQNLVSLVQGKTKD